MALKIYPDEGISAAYSQSGSMTNAFRQSFDGRNGTTREVKLYLGNDNAAKEYTTIAISAVTKTGRDVVNGVDGYGVKLSAGDTQPTAAGWEAISYGNTISMGSINGVAYDRPFWVRIEVPRGARAESFSGTVFKITADET